MPATNKAHIETAPAATGAESTTRKEAERMLQTLGTLPEPMLLAGDAPRARTTDPLTSHRAADRSQASRTTVRAAVLRLVNDFENLTGEEINGWYGSRADDGMYPMAKWDTPRKRASDLARDGLLTADRSDKLEAVYSLTDAGREFLEQVSA